MHEEILSNAQRTQLPLVQRFDGQFFLVGGTAVALQLGHRRSIDFDLFSHDPFSIKKIRSVITKEHRITRVYMEEPDQFTFILDGAVQWTFFQFPFSVPCAERLRTVIAMPDLLTLAAMKAYALGQRAKWKDYVDLAFIIERHHSIAPIAARAKELFGGEFNEKLFRVQIGFFNDIRVWDVIDYLPGYEKSDEEIMRFLEQCAIE